MRKEAFCERLEHKVFAGKANKLENWIYDYFFTMDSSLPPELRYKNRAKALAHATNELVGKYHINAENIAHKLNITHDDITIQYFTKLNDYVESIYRKHRAGYSQSQIKEYVDSLSSVKNELMELFNGTTIETLEIVGRPYYKTRGWNNPYTGGWYDGEICAFLCGVGDKFGIPSCYDKKQVNKKVKFKLFS